MKKTILILISMCICSMLSAQGYEDSLFRSAGFFTSPGLTSFVGPQLNTPTQPRYGMSLGFRFKNELKQGFFLEGGVGITSFGARFQTIYDTNINWSGDTLDLLKIQKNVTHLNITTPFLAGYRTQQGKVRFECALGFAFNLKMFEYSKTYETNYVINRSDVYRNLQPTFQPSFSAIARAGISLPVTNRATFDILPTFRYNFLYIKSEDKDAFQCAFTDLNKWSAGIDFGFTWKLDNKYTYTSYNEVKHQEESAYTIRYGDTSNVVQKPVRKKSNGPKNFMYLEALGNGMFFSQNYERTVYRHDEFSLQARAGFGMIPNNFFIPFGANVAFGKHSKKLEFGLGATVENFTADGHDQGKFKVHMVPSMAFRLEADSHLFLRLALLSHYFFDTGELLPGIGVSIGGCF